MVKSYFHRQFFSNYMLFCFLGTDSYIDFSVSSFFVASSFLFSWFDLMPFSMFIEISAVKFFIASWTGDNSYSSLKTCKDKL